MARSRKNFICITESGKVIKYAAQSIPQIMEKEPPTDYFEQIISTGLHSSYDTDYEELEWSDSI